MVLPEYYLIYLPENGYLKNSRGAAAPRSPMGRMPMTHTRKSMVIREIPEVYVHG